MAGPPEGKGGSSARGRNCAVFQILGTGYQPRDGDSSWPDHVHGHGLHRVPEREHPRRRVWPRGRRPGPDRTLRGHRPDRRRHDDRHGRDRQLSVRIGRGPRYQRHRRLLAYRSRTLACRGDGSHRSRGPRRRDPGGRRLPGGDHERRSPGPEAGDRGRHRPVHPVHRLRERGPDPVGLLAVRAAPGLRRNAGDAVIPDRTRAVRVPARPGDHDHPVGDEDPGRPGDLHPRDDGRRPPCRSHVGSVDPHLVAELLDAWLV